MGLAAVVGVVTPAGRFGVTAGTTVVVGATVVVSATKVGGTVVDGWVRHRSRSGPPPGSVGQSVGGLLPPPE